MAGHKFFNESLSDQVMKSNIEEQNRDKCDWKYYFLMTLKMPQWKIT